MTCFYKTTLYSLLLLSIGTFLSGCIALIAVGAGAGAFSYYAGNLVRTYNTDYHKGVRTSSRVIKDLKFTVTGKTGDGLKTVITGKRGDGTPVTINVQRVESNLTKIGVRNGLVGISNREASEQIHDRINRYLKKQSGTKAKSPTGTKKQTKGSYANVKPADQESGPTPSTEGVSPDGQLHEVGRSTFEPTTPIAPSLSRSSLYIYYRNNENTIPKSAYNILDRIVSHLKHNPETSIEIRGYTDSKGDPETNLKISQKRANTIGKYLIERGIVARRVTAKGFGARNFLASNRTENLRAMNRRVELQIK